VDLASALARASAVRKSLGPPGLWSAMQRARKARLGLRAQKDGESSAAPVAAGGAPDPGTLMPEAFVGAGQLPPKNGIPKRRKAQKGIEQARRMVALKSLLVQARKAHDGATYSGSSPLPGQLSDHPALTAQPTETYPNPDEMGGWLYVIDGGVSINGYPPDPNWIAFVDVNGMALLWTARDEEGGVIGAPYAFRRDDLIQPTDGRHRLRGYTASLPPSGAIIPLVVEGDTIPDPIVTDYHGLCIVIDRPAGFVQTKLADDGTVAWTRTYNCNYGYLPDTCNGDGDELDCFVSPPVDVSAGPLCEVVYWYCITDALGTFDEYKLVFGCATEADARAIILAHIPQQFVAPGSAMTTLGQIKALLGKEPVEREEALIVVSKSLDGMERSYKRANALSSVCKRGPTYEGAKPLPPELASHPALTAAPTEKYPNPADVGGWLYVIDSDDTSDPQGWVAFVGVDGKALLWTRREANGGVIGVPYEFQRPDLALPATLATATKSAAFRIVQKSSPTEEQYVLGVVLEPEVVDAQGEVYSADVIRQSAFNWLADYRNIDLQHKVFINRSVRVVESYIAPADMTIDGQAVKAGTWLLAVIVDDPALWAAIKRGEYTGFSINGLKRSEPIV
jgi:hypothetical protein